MEFTKKGIIEVLFANITDIHYNIQNEFGMDMSGDCTEQIDKAFASTIDNAYRAYAAEFGKTATELHEFIYNLRKPLGCVFTEIEQAFAAADYTREMDCLVSAEFSPDVDYSKVAEILELNDILDVDDLRIFFEDDEEWNSFSSVCLYELEKMQEEAK